MAENTIMDLQPFSTLNMPGPPRWLFIDINQRCNLRCQHCLYWKAKAVDSGAELSIDRRNELLREFAELSPGGNVVICGGESLLDPDRYFAVTGEARRCGLRSYSVTNGTCVTNEANAARLLHEGPAELTVSLNSHRPDVHDDTRGVSGSHAKAVRALRLLLDARSRYNLETPIYAMAVICERNYRDLDAFYNFVLNELGADKLKLNILQPTFGPPTLWYRDNFFAENVVRDELDLARIIRSCDAKYGLHINNIWLDQVMMYLRSVRRNGRLRMGWRSLRGTEDHICNSHDRNIMIDLQGRARLCFYRGFGSRRLKKPGDLSDFWQSAGPLRDRMRNCNRYCAISHSVRAVSATVR
ncbi:MAG TPA: radical SAM protein [Syntrophorhabdaceae bacterium]|nr:radical SAM protein [Syntrophorhabdaceae bacterium]